MVATGTRVTDLAAARRDANVAYLRYRGHVETCYRAYCGSPCITCDVRDSEAAAADWALMAALDAAQARGGREG